MFKRTIEPTVRIKNILCQRRWPMYSKNAVVWLAFAFDEPFTILWEKFQFLRNKDAYLSHNGHAKCQWSVSFFTFERPFHCWDTMGVYVYQWVLLDSIRYDTFNFDVHSIFFYYYCVFASIAIFWHKYCNKTVHCWSHHKMQIGF